MFLPKPYKGDFPITSEFNPERVHPKTGDPLTDGKIKPHLGIDIALPQGTLIHAPFDGKCTIYNQTTKEGKLTGYGHYIVLTGKTSLGTEVLCLFGHLSDFLVETGMYVTAGKEIGKSGNTGTSTGAHLHFGVATYDKEKNEYAYEDPRRYFSFANDDHLQGETFHF